MLATLTEVRADRLVAIVLLLQARGQQTAGQLAETLETSERTIRRDLDALLVAGVPLYSQRGRGGGWALLGGHRLDLSGFTAEEAQALFLVAGAGSPAFRGVEPGVRSALRKVFAALPEPLRAEADAAIETTVVEATGWWRSPEPPDEEEPQLAPLRAAVLARVQVELEYAKPGAPPSRRRVHPYGLVAKGGVWYLLAGTAEGRRTFRVSRVQGVTRLEQPAEIPQGFDLASEWASAQRDFLARLPGTQVELEVEERAVLALTSLLKGWAEVTPFGTEALEQVAVPPGWRRLSVTVPHPRAALAPLASFGAKVRVLSPPELRADLARLGEELVLAYGAPESERATTIRTRTNGHPCAAISSRPDEPAGAGRSAASGPPIR